MKLFLFFVLLPAVSLARKLPDIPRIPQITPFEELEPDKTINEQRKEHGGDTFSPYIISGNAAVQGQFPWQALLVMDNKTLCGGSLISKTFVLTAAHCINGATYISVTLGNLHYPPEQETYVKSFITQNKTIHENYANQVNDIGLVSFPAVQLTENVAVARLAPRSYQSESLVGSLVVASGFGRTSDASEAISDYLMYVSMIVMSNTECATKFNVVHIKFDKSVMCTFGASSNPTGSPCSGDSGSALVIKSADGLYTQVGIVAFGSSKGCALQYPAVYTRVSNYLDWIQEKTGIRIE